MIRLYNRKTEQLEQEKVLGQAFLSFLYEKPYGKPFLFFVKRKFLSSFYGRLMDTPWSKKMVDSFVRDHELSTWEILDPLSSFKNFNEFFSRKLKPEARPYDLSAETLISPADARLLVFEHLKKEAVLQVKGLSYSLKELLKDDTLAESYEGGTVLVFRLNPLDYHRFHFIDDGIPHETRMMEGSYYSVNPVALKSIPRLYVENKRAVTLFESAHFDTVLYVEVGATNVGTIIETFTPGEPVKKGAEKGYFRFGGSTVILFFKKDTIHLDADILHYATHGIETRVLFGETIGKSKS